MGESDKLPISLETKGQAAEANKIRLLNKESLSQASVETMEELMMHEESKGMGAARLRKARLAADALQRAKSLENSRMDKLMMTQKIAEERSALEGRMKKAYLEKRKQRKMRKELSHTLRKEMGRGRKISTGFAQCLRTSASAADLEAGLAKPETTFGVTSMAEFDIDELIVGGEGEPGTHRFDPRGYNDEVSFPGISDQEDGSIRSFQGDNDMQVSQDSLIDYTASIHSNGASSIYSGLSPGGGEEGVGFSVRKPDMKKMGAGFLWRVSRGKKKLPRVDALQAVLQSQKASIGVNPNSIKL